MKVSEYIAEFIAGISPRVYGVCGAGAMHLNDAICTHPAIEVIAMHHEQAAAFAAEADARVTGNIGVVMVTAGPGGTNALTGVSCAFVDSIPMLVISGQVTSTTMAKGGKGHGGGRRQGGMNELPVQSMMRSVTKMSFTIKDADDTQEIMHMAYEFAVSGRPGPVFIEVPLDIQAKEIDPKRDASGVPVVNAIRTREAYFQEHHRSPLGSDAIVKGFLRAKRPVILFGNGVRLANACYELHCIADLGVAPMVASWGAADILPSRHPSLLGRCGIFGDRTSNNAIYNSDFLLVVGSRLSPAQTGHAEDQFAPHAKIAMVDVDASEVTRPFVDIGYIGDAKEFLDTFYHRIHLLERPADWFSECRRTEKRTRMDDWATGTGCESNWINSYEFAHRLPGLMDKNAVVVTDVGFSYIPFFQTLQLNGKQRLIHSHGVSPMGWAIPAAVGAAMTNRERQVICLTGDGGAMMNIQELQTISQHRLPVTIFLFENDGYATMRIAQKNHFKREVISGPDTGLTLPNFHTVAEAFGIKSHYASKLETIETIMMERKKRMDPCFVFLHLDANQLIAPRLQARLEGGQFITPKFNDMWPHEKGDNDVEDRAGQFGQKVLGASEGSNRLAG